MKNFGRLCCLPEFFDAFLCVLCLDFILQGSALPCFGDADTHAPRMCQFPPLSVDDTAFPKRRAKTLIAAARKLYFGAAKIKLKTQSLLNTVKNSSKGEKINESYI